MTQEEIADRSSAEERAARARIGAAGKLLRTDKGGAPDDFATLLFGHAAPEDLVGYEPAQLAALAREAWTFLAVFCVTILTEAVGQSLVQAMFARNLFHSAAILRIIAVVVAIGFGYLFVTMAGLHVFVLGDLLSHAIVISLSYFWLKRNFARHGPGFE